MILDTDPNEVYGVERASSFPDRLRNPGRRQRWAWLYRQLDLLMPDQGAIRVLCPDKKGRTNASSAARYWARKLPGGCKLITGSEPVEDGAYHLYIALETVGEE